MKHTYPQEGREEKRERKEMGKIQEMKKVPMIQAKNISFAYENLSVLKDVSFEIEEGDFVAVLGPNGAGKSTLAKLIIGLLPMQKGSLEVAGTPVQQIRGKNIIGYMPQRYSIDRLFPGTVQEILGAQKKKSNIKKTKNNDGKREFSSSISLASDLGVNALLSKKFVELSGGQQQRVLITLALQNDPKVLILDEPTVGVDVKTERQFLSLLKHLSKERKITILLITHDVGMVPTVADKVLCINHAICCLGHASQTKELLSKVYGAHEEHHHHGHRHHD